MQGSTRIRTLTGNGDDGWGVFYRARAMIAAGREVTELTQGEHDIRTDPRILDAMHDATRRGVTGYSAVAGIPALRDAVAARIQDRTGVKTSRDNILITPGGQPALFAAHMGACDPGDTALYIDPYYATYPGTLRSASARPLAIAARPEHGFQPRAADIAAVAPGARSLLINSPNNPTGTVYSDETLQGIARVVREHEMWLISDEVYDTQVWYGRHLSPRTLPDMAERTLVVGSLSKSHAMTGSRLGWVVGPEEMISNLFDLANNTTYGVPGYIQEAGLFALGLGPEFEAQVAAPFRRRRDLVLAQVARQQVVRAIPAEGAMYVMLDVRATGLSGVAFAEGLLDAEAIAVMPGESFGTAAAGHIRVALTTSDARIEDAISRLLSFARQQAQAA